MNSQIQRQTAQILQFPADGRNALKMRGSQANNKQKPPDFAMTTSACGGAWYHDAAIVEAERPRKP